MLVPLSDEVCPFEAGPGHASRVALALLPPPGQFGQVSTASENRDCHRMAFLPLVWIGSSGTPAPPVARESREALKGTRPATTTGVPGPGRLECAALERSYSASTPLWCLNRGYVLRADILTILAAQLPRTRRHILGQRRRCTVEDTLSPYLVSRETLTEDNPFATSCMPPLQLRTGREHGDATTTRVSCPTEQLTR